MPNFKVTRYRVRITGEKQRPKWPFSIALLSDLHNVQYGEGNCELLQAIRTEQPSVILAAGDMITAGRTPQVDAALSLMDSLTKKYPVFYANGNHESRLKKNTGYYGDLYREYADKIRSYGVHLLENSSESIVINNMPLRIWGLELPELYFSRFRRAGLSREQLENWLGTPQEGEYHILLAHHPMYAQAYAEWGADLTLSGHLHGGLVRLPVLGGLISPQLRLFPKYDRGFYQVEGKRLAVSAGLGSHLVTLRVNNPPELVIIDFVAI